MALDYDMLLEQRRPSAGLTVQVVGSRHCWASLPPALCSQLYADGNGPPLVLWLTPLVKPGEEAGKPVAVTWGGAASSGPNVVELDAQQARVLGLRPGAAATLQPLKLRSQVAQVVVVEPAAAEDWEVLSMNAGLLEECMTSQVGVVVAGQAFCVWARQAVIRLRTVSTVPGDHGPLLVGAGTEVHVSPKPRQQQVQQPVGKPAPAAAGQLPPEASRVLLRALPMPEQLCLPLLSPSAGGQGLVGTTTTWLTAVALVAPCLMASIGAPAARTAVRALLSHPAAPSSSNAVAPAASVLLLASSLCPLGHIMVAPPVLQLLGVVPLTPMALAITLAKSLSADSNPPPLNILLQGALHVAAVAAGSKGQAEQAVANAALGHAQAQCEELNAEGAPGTQGLAALLSLWVTVQAQAMASLMGGQGQAAQLRSHPCMPGSLLHLRVPTATDSCWLLAAAQSTLPSPAPQVRLLSEPLLLPAQPSPGYPCSSPYPEAAAAGAWPVAVADLRPPLLHAAHEAFSRLTASNTGLEVPAVLVTGPPGSGRTAVVGAVAHLLSSATVPHHILTLRCGVVQSMQEQRRFFEAAVQEAVLCAPTLLFLERVDHLTPVSQDPEPHDSFCTSDVLAQLLLDLRPQAAASGPGGLAPSVRIIATAEDSAKISPVLRQAGLLDHQLRLLAPGADERLETFKAIGSRLAGVRLSDFTAGHMALNTDGYAGADLDALLARGAHAAATSALAQLNVPLHPMPITLDDARTAMDSYQPPAFWAMQQQTSTGTKETDLQDVGGMPGPKQALFEALILPLQHATLAATSPLRPRTGLLLFGPPGCGKTLLIRSAVAAACRDHNIRFISIKGPELLNKYIGQSEAAVRDLFARAAAAAPCALFFDEFDAIAPPRGHDSSGVTDRVVNQLLTELDGVEGLQGVCVLAATSRPDMVDPALLRPGRLDRMVYCGLPDLSDRLAILQASARRMQLGPDANLEIVAAQTEGYTGADLSAILAEGQLAAVHDVLSSPNSIGAALVVTAAHLQSALAQVRPSLPPHEREQFQQHLAQLNKPGVFRLSEGNEAHRPDTRVTQA